MDLLQKYSNGQGTAFRSLQYGLGQQPYVTKDINTGEIKLLHKVAGISDVLDDISQVFNVNESKTLSSISHAAIDVNRVGNFLLDGVKGPLFLASQVLLQASNIRANLGDSSLTGQLYDPTSPLVQTALDGVGGHIRRTINGGLVNKVVNGISSFLGFGDVLSLDDGTYESLYIHKGDANKPNSAIYRLFKRVYTDKDSTDLYSYFGGPDAIEGIGKTTVTRDYNTLLEQSLSPELNRGFVHESSPDNSIISKNPNVPFNILNYVNGKVSASFNVDNVGGLTSWNQDADSAITYNNYLGDTVTISTTKLATWSNINRENRIGSGRQDSINLTPIFTSNTDNIDYIKINNRNYTIRDLIKFRIESLNSDNPSGPSSWMVFRSYLTKFDDAYNTEWNALKYIGRGENFYTIGGFTRTISIGFKVAALSAIEMIPMYQKLNFLASNMAPNYKNGIMRGNFMKLTLGNYLYRQPGVLTSLNYSVANEYPWEIAMNEQGIGNSDKSLKGQALIMYELPHIIDVTLTFIPIGVGPESLLPETDPSSPFVLFKPQEADPVENIWLSNYYNTGKVTDLSSQSSIKGENNDTISGVKKNNL